MMPDSRIDHESVYALLMQEQWPEVLELVHRSRNFVDTDPLLSRAVRVSVDTFFQRLETTGASALKQELETLFLLHAGGCHRLDAEHFERVVEELVRLHHDRPDAAVGYARHCPENAVCTDVLNRYDVRERVEHTLEASIRLDETRPRAGVDHSVGLFRSRQEEAFFLAVREVFASYFAYPNVALSCLLDYERLRPSLASAERRYFFRGSVDCVVFDQQAGYRPRYFFELDSPHHDVDGRRENDAMKDRILAAAGKTLLRVRVRSGQVNRDTFVRLLGEVVRA